MTKQILIVFSPGIVCHDTKHGLLYYLLRSNHVKSWCKACALLVHPLGGRVLASAGERERRATCMSVRPSIVAHAKKVYRKCCLTQVPGVADQERLSRPIAHPICTSTGYYMVSQPLLGCSSFTVTTLKGSIQPGICLFHSLERSPRPRS